VKFPSASVVVADTFTCAPTVCSSTVAPAVASGPEGRPRLNTRPFADTTATGSFTQMQALAGLDTALAAQAKTRVPRPRAIWRAVTLPPSGPLNTEIRGEDRATLTIAGFVRFISLLDGRLLPQLPPRLSWSRLDWLWGRRLPEVADQSVVHLQAAFGK
jgi:hypothetical protein